MDQPARYTIKVKGHLDKTWAEWFDGLSITNRENGEAVIEGRIADQSALHGVLNRISDLGLTLVSVDVGTDDE